MRLIPGDRTLQIAVVAEAAAELAADAPDGAVEQIALAGFRRAAVAISVEARADMLPAGVKGEVEAAGDAGHELLNTAAEPVR